ncbi:MAG: hypothetical protein LBQ05_03420, partial [Christensenellaceae bacterium]|nr:hypothetical protein [Christensenellaceae bacterium]
RLFAPVVEKATTDFVPIKKLRNFNYKPNRKLYVPKKIKPLTDGILHYKKIPFNEIYSASKFIADKISPKLSQHLSAMHKHGALLDEQLTTQFDDEMWEVHIDNTYTPDDTLSVLHEMGHEICLLPDILSEIPSITTEFLADKILQKYNVPTPYFMTAKNSRIKDMIDEGYMVEFTTDLFEEYERNGKKMTPQIAEEFDVTDLSTIKDGLEIEIPYFIGSASSMVLADNIRDGKDYDDAIEILSNRNIGKVRKLRELNITPKTLEESFIKNLQK